MSCNEEFELSLADLINAHVLGFHHLVTSLSELASDAPPELAAKIQTLAKVASQQRDDLDGLLMNGAFNTRNSKRGDQHYV